jgi:hypothetical protein
MAVLPPESFRALVGKAALFVRPLATFRNVEEWEAVSSIKKRGQRFAVS